MRLFFFPSQHYRALLCAIGIHTDRRLSEKTQGQHYNNNTADISSVAGMGFGGWVGLFHTLENKKIHRVPATKLNKLGSAWFVTTRQDNAWGKQVSRASPPNEINCEEPPPQRGGTPSSAFSPAPPSPFRPCPPASTIPVVWVLNPGGRHIRLIYSAPLPPYNIAT